MKTLQEWLAFCEQLHPVTIDMGLDRVKAVADRMALRFDCPVITVAGTNGKGSTCAMLEAILLEAGYKTGVYTSPHLVHFEERCRLHGESASAVVLAQAFVAAPFYVNAARVAFRGVEPGLLERTSNRTSQPIAIGNDHAPFARGERF